MLTCCCVLNKHAFICRDIEKPCYPVPRLVQEIDVLIAQELVWSCLGELLVATQSIAHRQRVAAE